MQGQLRFAVVVTELDPRTLGIKKALLDLHVVRVIDSVLWSERLEQSLVSLVELSVLGTERDLCALIELNCVLQVLARGSEPCAAQSRVKSKAVNAKMAVRMVYPEITRRCLS